MPNIGKHSLDALGTERIDIQADHNPWKIPVVSSLQPRPENARAQNMTQSVNSSALKQQKPNMGTKAQKLQVSSAFKQARPLLTVRIAKATSQCVRRYCKSGQWFHRR